MVNRTSGIKKNHPRQNKPKMNFPNCSPFILRCSGYRTTIKATTNIDIETLTHTHRNQTHAKREKQKHTHDIIIR